MKAKDLQRAQDLMVMLGRLIIERDSVAQINNQTYRVSVKVNDSTTTQLHFHKDVWFDALVAEAEVIKAELDNLGVEVEDAA